jgi:hypothetical protein
MVSSRFQTHLGVRSTRAAKELQLNGTRLVLHPENCPDLSRLILEHKALGTHRLRNSLGINRRTVRGLPSE